MKCPTCPDSVLVMSDRQGIEIDYCPQCRGVWLDRGELDKIIEKSAVMASAASGDVSQQSRSHPQQQPPSQNYQRQPDFVDSDYRHHNAQGYGQRRKKSWMSELFD